tara:strand:- start:256 stop:519 length:264 start_codon:yes stop_codon:yes gene_type:complete
MSQTEYEKRAKDPCWQRNLGQELISLFPITSHDTSYLWRKEDGSYYWQHAWKKAEDDIFVDVNNLQLDMFGTPHLSDDWVRAELFGV